jgi:hypothetical protein
MSAQWLGRAEFAEFAEALGVSTDLIVGVVPVPTTIEVLFMQSEDADEDDVFSMLLARDEDGIFRPLSQPVRRPGLIDALVEQLDEDQLE